MGTREKEMEPVVVMFAQMAEQRKNLQAQLANVAAQMKKLQAMLAKKAKA